MSAEYFVFLHCGTPIIVPCSAVRVAILQTGAYVALVSDQPDGGYWSDVTRLEVKRSAALALEWARSVLP